VNNYITRSKYSLRSLLYLSSKKEKGFYPVVIQASRMKENENSPREEVYKAIGWENQAEPIAFQPRKETGLIFPQWQ